MGRRSRTDIINDMLRSIQEKGGEIKPTHLLYKSNLSHTLMQSYLEELVSKEYIKKIERNTYEYIILTDRGYQLLIKLKEMREFEEAFGIK